MNYSQLTYFIPFSILYAAFFSLFISMDVHKYITVKRNWRKQYLPVQVFPETLVNNVKMIWSVTTFHVYAFQRNEKRNILFDVAFKERKIFSWNFNRIILENFFPLHYKEISEVLSLTVSIYLSELGICVAIF